MEVTAAMAAEAGERGALVSAGMGEVPGHDRVVAGGDEFAVVVAGRRRSRWRCGLRCSRR